MRQQRGPDEQAPEFDASTLNELAADLDVDTAKEIIASYLQEAPSLLAQAQNALHEHRMEDFLRAVHTLKSTSAHVGATRLSRAAQALETEARAGRWPQDAQPVARLRQHFEAIHGLLREWNG